MKTQWAEYRFYDADGKLIEQKLASPDQVNGMSALGLAQWLPAGTAYVTLGGPVAVQEVTPETRTAHRGVLGLTDAQRSGIKSAVRAE